MVSTVVVILSLTVKELFARGRLQNSCGKLDIFIEIQWFRRGRELICYPYQSADKRKVIIIGRFRENTREISKEPEISVS